MAHLTSVRMRSGFLRSNNKLVPDLFIDMIFVCLCDFELVMNDFVILFLRMLVVSRMYEMYANMMLVQNQREGCIQVLVLGDKLV